MDPPPALTRHRRDVEAYLRTIIDSPGKGLLYRMMRYHLGWEDEQGAQSRGGGKGLRPGLCLLASRAAGGRWQAAVPAAAAVELVHNFSLVHDDIQDRDQERHHRPTVWAVWGEAQAINAGDALLALARLALAGLAEQGVSDESSLRAMGALDRATLEMVEGQTLDLVFEGRTNVHLEEYIDMVLRKTGALFGCALELGALAAGAEPALQEEFRRLGRALGIAYQLRDDVLGVWGDAVKTGKPAASDVLHQKKSLPFVLAAIAASRAEFEELCAAYARADVGAALGLFEGLGVRRLCEEQISGKTAEAAALLRGLRISAKGSAEMKEAADFLLQRDY